MTFTSRDLRDQITRATDASDGTYDVDAITEEIIEKHGAIDIDTIDSDEFWDIVGKHATSSAHYAIEVSDDGENWQTEKDESQGAIDLEGDTPQKVAADMLDDRVTDLRSMDIEPSRMRVAIWASRDAADSGKAPLAVAERTG